MATQLFTNAHLATMSAAGHDYAAIESAAFVVADGCFSWLGKMTELPAMYGELPATDLAGAWVTPGLIDCHTHLVYAGNRAKEFELRLQGVSYADIARAGGGILSTVRATRLADQASLFAQTARRLQQLLSEGVTSIEIKSGYGLDMETEIRMLQVARQLADHFPVTIKTTYLGAHALPPEYQHRADDYIEFVCTQVLPCLVQEQLVDAVDVFCETIGFNLQQTERVFQAARALGLPVKVHAEQLSCMRAAGLAANYQALSADHLEYLSADCIAAMAANQSVAVLLPGAFYYLRETQLPPIAALRAAGVPIAVATDCNPGSSPMVSLLLMLNMACTLFRLTPCEALAGVTIHAAQALGMQATHGSMLAGKVADFVCWDIQTPAELAYQIGLNPLLAVYKAGQLIKTTRTQHD